MVFCSDRFLAKPGSRRSRLERFTLLDPAKSFRVKHGVLVFIFLDVYLTTEKGRFYSLRFYMDEVPRPLLSIVSYRVEDAERHVKAC